jgi:hypothetical protein
LLFDIKTPRIGTEKVWYYYLKTTYFKLYTTNDVDNEVGYVHKYIAVPLALLHNIAHNMISATCNDCVSVFVNSLGLIQGNKDYRLERKKKIVSLW